MMRRKNIRFPVLYAVGASAPLRRLQPLTCESAAAATLFRQPWRCVRLVMAEAAQPASSRKLH
jgi:hypothetical protein